MFTSTNHSPMLESFPLRLRPFNQGVIWNRKCPEFCSCTIDVIMIDFIQLAALRVCRTFIPIHHTREAFKSTIISSHIIVVSNDTWPNWVNVVLSGNR